MEISFQSVVPVPASLCMLFRLNVRKNGQISIWASPQFMAAIATRLMASQPRAEKEARLGALSYRTTTSAGSVLRVSDFDFMEVRRNQYVGVADTHDELTYTKAMDLASHILAAYRMMLLFEKVFAEDGSYNKWFLFNHRPPTAKELLQLAQEKGIYIPFLEVPFTSPLLQEAEAPTPQPLTTQPLRVVSKNGTLRVVPRVAAPSKIQQLASSLNERFGHSR